jgi:transposase
MARYKEYSYDQGKLIPVSFREQIIPGSFEFALNDIVDNVLDLSLFEKRFSNDETGASAYDPRVLLKIVLYAYSRGINHSRDIARCCVENVMFMALSADSGFHSEANMRMLSEEGIDGYVADNMFRKRDPKFSDANRHKKPVGRHKTPIWTKRYFRPEDFTYNETDGTLICPAGNKLYVKNRNYVATLGRRGIAYAGWKTKCRACEIRKKCLRRNSTEFRQVVLFDQSGKGPTGPFTRRMITKFDSALGRFIYSRRMETVEPVFANICRSLGLNRITLRGKVKADTQWKLYSIVHNIFKIYRYGVSYAR